MALVSHGQDQPRPRPRPRICTCTCTCTCTCNCTCTCTCTRPHPWPISFNLARAFARSPKRSSSPLSLPLSTLVRYKGAFEKAKKRRAVSDYDEPLTFTPAVNVKQFNSYIWDFSNALWRNMPLPQTDPDEASSSNGSNGTEGTKDGHGAAAKARANGGYGAKAGSTKAKASAKTLLFDLPDQMMTELR